MTERLKARIGLVARRGEWPKRWWCALRGHHWVEQAAWTRIRIEDGPWRMVHDKKPAVVCELCKARQPWESEFAHSDFTLDQVLVVPRD